MTQRNPDQPIPSSSLGLFQCRLGWFLLAPAAMFAIAMGIAQADSAAMTKLDLAYLLTACLAITLRWISFLGGDLTDAFGDPSSTTASVKSHSIRMAMISVVLWGLVKGIAAY